MEPHATLPRLARRFASFLLCAGLALVWLLDLITSDGLRTDEYTWLPALVCGPLAAVLLYVPDRWLRLEWRAGAAALGSCALTAVLMLPGRPVVGWGAMESTCLLILLGRAARRVPRPAAAFAVSAALGFAVIVAPVRMRLDADSLGFSFLLTFAVGAAAGLGCYLRLLDARRVRAVAEVRRGERLDLARDLHDFVAHHVTGIVVQAQAARTIRETAPENVDPILRNIEQAGMETLDSMRRLVRVLREEEGGSGLPGEVFAELAELVADFSRAGGDATLNVAAPARRAQLAPEVETSVHRVVQEALTNVRRHASCAPVTVRADAGSGWLRVEVRNAAPAARAAATAVTAATALSGASAVPVGGRGGFGIVGLRERVTAVGGDLEAGGTEDGGWRVTGTFPVLAEAGSAG